MQQQELLSHALKLSPKKRSELIAQLIRSLDQEEDDDLSPAEWQTVWTKEIKRRLAEIKSGKAKLIAGDEVFRGVRKSLKSRRK